MKFILEMKINKLTKIKNVMNVIDEFKVDSI